MKGDVITPEIAAERAESALRREQAAHSAAAEYAVALMSAIDAVLDHIDQAGKEILVARLKEALSAFHAAISNEKHL